MLGELEIVKHASVMLRRTKEGRDPLIGTKDSDLCSKSHDSDGAQLEMGAFISDASRKAVLERAPSLANNIPLVYPRGEIVDWHTALKERPDFVSPFDMRHFYISGLTSIHLWYFMKNESFGSLFNTTKTKEHLTVSFPETYTNLDDFKKLFQEGFGALLHPKSSFISLSLSVPSFRKLCVNHENVYKCSNCNGLELLCDYGDLYYVE